MVLVLQCLGHSATAIAGAAFAVYFAHRPQQCGRCGGPRGPSSKGVIAAGRHLEQPAHHADWSGHQSAINKGVLSVVDVRRRELSDRQTRTTRQERGCKRTAASGGSSAACGLRRTASHALRRRASALASSGQASGRSSRRRYIHLVARRYAFLL